MKITRIELFITAVPHIPEIEKSRPGDYRERPIPIIRVHTDEGIHGIAKGAAATGWRMSRSGSGSIR